MLIANSSSKTLKGFFFILYNSKLHDTYFVKLSDPRCGLSSSFLIPLVLAPSLTSTACPIAIFIDG